MKNSRAIPSAVVERRSNETRCPWIIGLGGKGANQAAAAALLDYPTYFVGQVGDDSHATMLRKALEDSGVQLDYTVRSLI